MNEEEIYQRNKKEYTKGIKKNIPKEYTKGIKRNIPEE